MAFRQGVSVESVAESGRYTCIVYGLLREQKESMVPVDLMYQRRLNFLNITPIMTNYFGFNRMIRLIPALLLIFLYILYQSI